MSQIIFPLMAMLIAILLAGGCLVAGMLTQPYLSDFDAAPLLGILVLAFVLFCAVNRVGAVIYARRRFEMRAEDRDRWLNDERAAACEKDPDAALRELGNLSVLPVLLLALYFLLVLGMAFVLGLFAMDGEFKLIGILFPILLCYLPLILRFQLIPGRLCRDRLVPDGEMPLIRAIAEKAARTAGIKGKVCLHVIQYKDISIQRYGRTYVVYLGTRSLAVASERELYAAILREFVYYSDPRMDRRTRRYERLAALGNASPRLGTWIFDVFFSPADVYMEWSMIFYKLALSRKLDLLTAACMKREGCAVDDLSMMVKEEMYGYFDHEWYGIIPESPYAHAEEPGANERAICDAYRDAMRRRYGVWRSLVAVKLPAETFVGASLAEQCRLLGVSLQELPDTPELPSPESPLGAECTHPPLLPIQQQQSYQSARKINYLDPLEVIQTWEASDRNQPSYELSPVLNAYLALHRVRELEALCDKILATEPDFAHAVYFKGMCLLLRYEIEGIDRIYRAIDLNKNYMQEGFEMIDTYCRLMGLSDELSALLRRQESTLEAHAAEHNDASSLHVTDRLVRETALDDELPAMLAYMAAAGGGCIDRIYLVRKVISEDFFSSVFVIAFAPDATEQAKHDAYTAVFHYLDAADWQYSLFVLNRNTEAAVGRVPDSLVWERKKE